MQWMICLEISRKYDLMILQVLCNCFRYFHNKDVIITSIIRSCVPIDRNNFDVNFGLGELK